MILITAKYTLAEMYGRMEGYEVDSLSGQSAE